MHACYDSAECETEQGENHWIGARLLTNCACTVAPCRDCRPLWQWEDGSSVYPFYYWLANEEPVPNAPCAYIGAATSAFFDHITYAWYATDCENTWKVFCEKGILYFLAVFDKDRDISNIDLAC